MWGRGARSEGVVMVGGGLWFYMVGIIYLTQEVGQIPVSIGKVIFLLMPFVLNFASLFVNLR